MELTTLTDEELDQLRIEVLTEQERRRLLVEAPAHAEALAIAYATAVGRKPGDPYQPVTGAHDAYPQGLHREPVGRSLPCYRMGVPRSRHDRRTIRTNRLLGEHRTDCGSSSHVRKAELMTEYARIENSTIAACYVN